MPRTIAYRAGGFTNCGIGYTKFSQEELAERRDRAMTENEAIYCLKADSESHSEVCEECNLHGLVGCDHCQNDAIEVAIKALEEVQQYREIGTPEECREAVDKQTAKKPYLQPVQKNECREDECWECPSCDSFLGYEVDCRDEHYRENNCPNCGQKLDWNRRTNDEKID